MRLQLLASWLRGEQRETLGTLDNTKSKGRSVSCGRTEEDAHGGLRSGLSTGGIERGPKGFYFLAKHLAKRGVCGGACSIVKAQSLETNLEN